MLWHGVIAHTVGQNASSDTIRQATIYGYLKTPAAVPDDLAADDAGAGIWRDWSDEVKAV